MHRLAPKHWAFAATAVVTISTIAFALAGAGDAGTAITPPALEGEDRSTRTTSSRPAHGTDHAPTPPAGTGHSGPHGLDADEDPEISNTPPFPVEDGNRPSRSEALEFETRYSRFTAKGTEGLDKLADEGHLKGAGTMDDPYILEDFYVKGDLIIQSTDRPIILRNGYVNGQLKLNYIGDAVYVHHVYARDLRVNENVERSGENTGGLFHDNSFAFVGQIRHFIGEFRDNTIGPKPEDGIVTSYLSDTGAAQLAEGIVFNFDGFHGADMHDNVFKGQVDIKLHGHNHANCLFCPVHNHADGSEHPEAVKEEGLEERYAVDPALGFRSRHSVRYHSLLFRDNVIDVPGGAFALRYNDRNHAGDDQTANSEPNEYLEDAHVHYQHVILRGNDLRGAPILVDIFNAEDDLHVIQNQGILKIEGNTVDIPYTGSDDGLITGIRVRDADGITLRITENRVTFTEQDDGAPLQMLRNSFDEGPMMIGLMLDDFALGDVIVEGNHVNQGDYGVLAAQLASPVYWDLVANDFQTDEEYRSQGTANRPGERAASREDDP